MPYVPVLAGKRADLLQTAERRWGAILVSRPDLAPAVDLQRRLLALVAELGRTIDEGRVPRLSLPGKYLAAKLARGVPALSGEPIPLPLAVMKPTLVRLCDALGEGGAGDAATHIRDAITGGNIETGSLLTASLTRNQAAIRTGATHRGLAPDLMWLIAELAVSPFVHTLQRILFPTVTKPCNLPCATGTRLLSRAVVAGAAKSWADTGRCAAPSAPARGNCRLTPASIATRAVSRS
jgi:hypothetical protein